MGLALGRPVALAVRLADDDFRTSPPPRQKASARSKAGNGGVSNTVLEGDGTTIGEDCCGASIISFTHRRRLVMTMSIITCRAPSFANIP